MEIKIDTKFNYEIILKFICFFLFSFFLLSSCKIIYNHDILGYSNIYLQLKNNV